MSVKKKSLLFVFTLVTFFVSSCKNTQQIIPTQTAMPTMTLTPTKEPTATITPTPKPEYPVISDMEDIQDCYIPYQELLDGSYWNWLNDVIAPTLLDEFKTREDKIKYIKPVLVGIPNMGSGFIFPKYNYGDPETRPWKRDVTFAYTSEFVNGENYEYIVAPIFFYKTETQRVYPVVSLVPIRLKEGITPETPEWLDSINWKKETYLENMNVPVIVYSQSYGQFNEDNIEMTAPIVEESYVELGEIEVWRRIKRFYDGDVSAFSFPGMVVFADIAQSNAYK